MENENISKSSHLWILVSGALSGLIFGAFGYVTGISNTPGVKPEPAVQGIIAEETVKYSNTPVPSQLTPTEWESFTNASNFYSINFPTGWKIERLSTGELFGPANLPIDTYWSVLAYKKSDYSPEQIKERNEVNQNIIIETKTSYMVISDNIQNPLNHEFEKFHSSFKLID